MAVIISKIKKYLEAFAFVHPNSLMKIEDCISPQPGTTYILYSPLKGNWANEHEWKEPDDPHF